MSTDKAQLIDTIQKYLGKSNWKAAVAEMEKLFAIDPQIAEDLNRHANEFRETYFR